jgi:hypothetical protein
MAVWICPECKRRFGRRHQGHECAPAMTLEEYFSTGTETCGRPTRSTTRCGTG